jgi:hypothetical protein
VSFTRLDEGVYRVVLDVPRLNVVGVLATGSGFDLDSGAISGTLMSTNTLGLNATGDQLVIDVTSISLINEDYPYNFTLVDNEDAIFTLLVFDRQG